MEDNLIYAGFWKRAAAKIIDSLIFIPFAILNVIAVRSDNESIVIICGIGTALINYLYNVLFVYFKGYTIGKKVLNLRVIKTDTTPVSLANAILRESFAGVNMVLSVTNNYLVSSEIVNLVYISFAFFMIIDCLFNLVNEKRKTLHDYLGDTIVVEAKGGY